MRARTGSGTIAGLMVGELVREALESYFHAKERARLEQGLGIASQLVRKESMRNSSRSTRRRWKARKVTTREAGRGLARQSQPQPGYGAG